MQVRRRSRASWAMVLSEHGFDVHHAFLFRRTASFDAMPNTVFCAKERPQGLISLFRLFRELYSHIRQLRPDAVLCFQHYGNLIAAPIARLAGVRVIIANRTSAIETMPKWARAADALFGTLGVFTSVVVNSGNTEREYARYPRTYRGRLVKVEHGFAPKLSALDQRAARQSFDLPEKAVLLGCVARLHPLKNLQAAVHLLPGHKERHVALVGQGPDHNALVELARLSGCSDRLHLLGEQTPERVADFLAALDAFVFPSLAETFGLAAAEAAQAGVPVIANDLDVLREVLAVDGKPCAAFANSEDREAFSRAVGEVVSNADLAQELSDRGRKLNTRYSVDRMLADFVTLLKPLVGAPRAVRK